MRKILDKPRQLAGLKMTFLPEDANILKCDYDAWAEACPQVHSLSLGECRRLYSYYCYVRELPGGRILTPEETIDAFLLWEELKWPV